MNVRSATSADREGIQALLLGSALSPEGMGCEFPAHHWVLVWGADVIASLGLERCGSYGLFCGLAVAPLASGGGFGSELLLHALSTAQKAGLRAVFARTIAPVRFFRDSGLTEISKHSVPTVVQRRAHPSTPWARWYTWETGR